MGVKQAFSFGTDLWDPSNRFETSWILSPWVLFACRALISLYAFTTRIISLVINCETPKYGGCTSSTQSFSYFTILTYWGIAFYFFFAALHTATYAINGRPLLERFPRWLQALHGLYYTTIVVFPWLVTIVYWGVIFGGEWFDDEFKAWENVSQHMLNSVFALFEIVFPRTNPMSWVHVPFMLLLLSGYLAVAYITFATQGFYTYDFLNYESVGSRGIVAAYCVGIAVASIIVFCLVWCLIWVRRWVTEKKLGMDGKFAGQSGWTEEREMGRMEVKDSRYPSVTN